MSKQILIAKIISVFGIKGEVKIVAYCQDPLQIEKYPLFDKKGNKLSITISNKNKTVIAQSASGDPILIVKINSLNNRNEAEAARGMEIFVNREDFQETAEDEFYHIDLIGLKVQNSDNSVIGKILNVQDFGAGGMLEIEFLEEFCKSAAGKNFNKIENLPFSSKFFPEVKVKEGFIRIDLPEILTE